ncbi:DUF4307 domain-containing protein [Nocardioides sp. TRM66260-LWL]|uniref:DUF4307 domain-containing protein n=1 Tax=Nocardioides sp. TRM66260-LWL TaxID=2874478 RepID=UPI001CC585DF|nr:DUF4307 domain-containing protein [Nocardioides sp. TRM66260-LWL]MBZ5736162.1 DUF4307 domain-containing protein [Nocardioides sp. TRM66260-LWL]
MSAPDLQRDTPRDELADRYGAPRPWRRRGLILASLLLAVVFGGWLTWTTVVHANPEVASDLQGFDVVDEHTATATIAVDVRSGVDASGARCLLRAFAADHTTVGELTFTPTGTGRYTESIRTERRATSVESVGCTTPTQNRPR